MKQNPYNIKVRVPVQEFSAKVALQGTMQDKGNHKRNASIGRKTQQKQFKQPTFKNSQKYFYGDQSIQHAQNTISAPKENKLKTFRANNELYVRMDNLNEMVMDETSKIDNSRCYTIEW